MKPGDMLIMHEQNGESNLRIVHIDIITDSLWVGDLSFANEQGVTRKAYCPQPKRRSLKEIQNKIAAGSLTCVPFKSPSEWSWTDKDFKAADLSILRRERRQRLKWRSLRDKAFALIEPLVIEYSVDQILERSLHTSWPSKRAKELGLKSSRDIYSALHKFIVGLGNKNALLPSYGKCGGVGVQKFFTSAPGQTPEGGTPAFNSDALSRVRMGLGWKKYKNEGTAVRIAHHRFLDEFYASDVSWINGEMVVALLPEGSYPSIDQFKEWGPRHEGNMAARSINAGESLHRNKALLRSGQTRTSVLAVGVLGQIDTTPCDQNLVSEASRLKVLRTPYKAEVTDSLFGYVCGVHVGFEHPCTTTNLLAILNAATSKVEFCERYGVRIKEEEWLHINFRRLLGDNGEMKSETGMVAIEEMESSVEFCESYFGERKAVAESSNRRGHVHNDHMIPGSNKGRQTKRGEKQPGLDACFTFQEYMPRLIRSILYRNNEEVIQLPMMEMRKDGVRPVRIEMMKWCIEKGYVASMPTDIDALRVRCLPRLQAVLHADGVHLFDPTSAKEHLIPSLRYSSQWLRNSDALRRASATKRRLEAHVNPSNLQEIWINLDGLKPLQIQTRDPYMEQVTLYDWLTISRDDKVNSLLSRQQDLEYHVGRVATIDHVASQARKKKKQELVALGKKLPKSKQLQGKRENTYEEMRAQGLFPKAQAVKQQKMDVNLVAAPVIAPPIKSNTPTNPMLALLRRIRQGERV